MCLKLCHFQSREESIHGKGDLLINLKVDETRPLERNASLQRVFRGRPGVEEIIDEEDRKKMSSKCFLKKTFERFF